VNILFLVSLNKNFGGGDYSIFKFAEALAGRGHQVAIFYLGNNKIIRENAGLKLTIYRK
jgi:hypothetical protein